VLQRRLGHDGKGKNIRTCRESM